MKLAWTLILSVAVLACLSSSADADVTIEMKYSSKRIVSGKETIDTGVDKTYIKSGKYAFENHMGMTSIYSLEKKLLWSFETKTKKYRETTFEQLARQQERAKERTKKSIAQYKAMLKNPQMPEASKKSLRAAMAALSPKYSLKKGDSPEKIAGHDCAHYIILVNGKKQSEVWLAEGLEGAEEVNRVTLLGKSYGDSTEEMLKQLKGIQLKTRFEMKNQWMSMTMERVATKVTIGAIDDKRFEVPEGFEKQAKK